MAKVVLIALLGQVEIKSWGQGARREKGSAEALKFFFFFSCFPLRSSISSLSLPWSKGQAGSQRGWSLESFNSESQGAKLRWPFVPAKAAEAPHRPGWRATRLSLCLADEEEGELPGLTSRVGTLGPARQQQPLSGLSRCAPAGGAQRSGAERSGAALSRPRPAQRSPWRGRGCPAGDPPAGRGPSASHEGAARPLALPPSSPAFPRRAAARAPPSQSADQVPCLQYKNLGEEAPAGERERASWAWGGEPVRGEAQGRAAADPAAAHRGRSRLAPFSCGRGAFCRPK